MTVKEYRERAAIEKARDRDTEALVRKCWPVVKHWCAFCGEHVTRKEASPHHLVPRERGGGDNTGNLVLVHKGICHDRIEMWTVEHGRPPAPDEWGRLMLSNDDNLLTPGVGTRPQERRVFVPEPALSVSDVPRYLAYLQRIDGLYQKKIAKNPDWGRDWLDS